MEEKIQQELTRHRTEQENVNGTYESYCAKQDELADVEAQLFALLKDVFQHAERKENFGILARRTLLEARRDELVGSMEVECEKNPTVAALIEYDKLMAYVEQLRTQSGGFIWTESRKRIMDELLHAVVSGRTVITLIGETGVGKTAFVRALSQILNGREPDRSVGGERATAESLFAKVKIDNEGSFFEYGPILRAITGKDSSRDETPQRSGSIFFDDEFNARPQSVQRQITKTVSEIRAGRSFAVPGTSITETAQSGFLYVAAGNPAGDRHEREETGIETLREMTMIHVPYMEQTPENPELYQVLEAALADSGTKRFTAVTPGELEPKWEQNATTKKMASVDRSDRRRICIPLCADVEAIVRCL